MRILKKIVGFPKNALIVAGKVDSNKWARLLLALDYMYCRIRYHVTNSEYLDFKFYNLKDRYRKNFLLKYHQNNKFRKLNSLPTLTKSKYNFYQTIPDCFSHEMILAPKCGADVFVEFAKKHKTIVIKPEMGSMGRDISIFTYTDDEQAQKRFSSFSENYVCEEYIRQHEKMTELSPFSVNSIRFVTLREQNDIEIVSATLRTGGRVGAIIDNLKNNGVGAQIDINTGIVCTCGFDYNDNLYVNHPISGIQFLGFNIPNFDKAVALVKKAHGQIPQNGLLGWDIAITQDGADVIEANARPGTPITQMVDRIPKGEKILKAIRNAEKSKCKKR